MQIDFRRGRTARRHLLVDWTFPVWKPETPMADPNNPNATVITEVRRALPRAKAFELVSEGDRRPLLIMRECAGCAGSDEALIDRSLESDTTVLLSHWFRCIKIPMHVLEGDHPLHNLFEGHDPMPHMMFGNPDGSDLVPLGPGQKQSDLWKIMYGKLDTAYEGDPSKTIKKLQKILTQYDTIDNLEDTVKRRLEREIEKRGPKSPQVRKLEGKIDELAIKRDNLKEELEALRDLGLKQLEEKAKGTELVGSR